MTRPDTNIGDLDTLKMVRDKWKRFSPGTIHYIDDRVGGATIPREQLPLLCEGYAALDQLIARLEGGEDIFAPTVSDYEEVLADHRRLVRELDVALNGDNAAKQASLCDIVAQVKAEGITARLDGDGAKQPIQFGYDPGIAGGDVPALTFRKGERITCVLYGDDARAVSAFIKQLAEAEPDHQPVSPEVDALVEDLKESKYSQREIDESSPLLAAELRGENIGIDRAIRKFLQHFAERNEVVFNKTAHMGTCCENGYFGTPHDCMKQNGDGLATGNGKPRQDALGKLSPAVLEDIIRDALESTTHCQSPIACAKAVMKTLSALPKLPQPAAHKKGETL